MALIEVTHLTKKFGPVTAVDDLGFSIEAGTITGFLGPNGSGKSTTLRSLVGLVEPTSGTATIDGRHYRELGDPLREVGVMLEAAAHPARNARNHLRMLASEAGVPRSRVDEMLELVELRDAAGRKIGGFSLGMRQRLGLAGALIGDPGILILDEPANGLDPEGMRWMRDFLRQLAAQGRTVLLSSHVLAEVAQTVDDVIVISEGRLVTQASLSELMESGSTHRVRVRSPQSSALGALLDSQEGVAFTNGADVLSVTGTTAEAIGQLAFDNRIVLHEITPESSSLEDVFMNLTTTKEIV